MINMARSPLIFRIAMLNADFPMPNVLQSRGSYGNIFHGLLVAAAARVAPGLTIESVDFDVVQGEYPETPVDFDALLISGSASSSYDEKPWCRTLEHYVHSTYRQHPHVKIFGSCFGHQMICQSLLRDSGVRVEKDPNGWELGVHEIQLEPAFVKALGGPASRVSRQPVTPEEEDGPRISESAETRGDHLRLQFVHADHVKVPEGASLPDSWIPMGRSAHCALQGVYEPGRVLTYQGHFEFDSYINIETIKVFGAKWEAAALAAAIAAMDKDDDSEAAADMVMRFFLEGRDAVFNEGGLMTPPLAN